ncbi:MAG: hypothetical protein ACLQVJ_07265 [Syntrophobacteraceae bacterium]
MDEIQNIFYLFIGAHATIEIVENDVSLTSNCTSSHINIPAGEELSLSFSAFPERDKIVLYISVDGGEALLCNSKSMSNDIGAFISELNDKKQVSEEDSQFEIRLSIDKVADKDGTSIYSLDQFSRFLLSLDLVGVLHVMVRLFSGSDTVTFDCLEDIDSFYTESIRFCHKDSTAPSHCTTLNTAKKVGLRVYQTDTCHFTNASEYKFVPDDFFLLQRSVKFQQLNQLLDKLALFFCIIFIFDVSTIEEQTLLSFKLNGYRMIRSSLDFTSVNVPQEVLNDYFNLYKWIYTEGNLNDKIGLARNIISLQVINNDPSNILGSVAKSTLSSYEIYLKDNIRQYIEVKNKVDEFLTQSSKDASKIVEDLAKSYKNSFLAFSSFFTSVIILRLLSKGEFSEVLTKDITFLSLGILIISFVILISSTYEVCQGKSRFIGSYTSLKHRYEDILNKDDIDNIFNHDMDFKRDCSFITKRIVIYFCIWFFSIILFSGIIAYLGKAHLSNFISPPHSIKYQMEIPPDSVSLDSPGPLGKD